MELTPILISEIEMYLRNIGDKWRDCKISRNSKYSGLTFSNFFSHIHFLDVENAPFFQIVAKIAVASEEIWNDRLKKEYHNMKALNSQNFPCPQALGYLELESESRGCLLMEKIPGNTLTQIFKGSNYSDKNLDSLLNRYFLLIESVQNINTTGMHIGNYLETVADMWGVSLTNPLIEITQNNIEACKKYGLEYLVPIGNWLIERLPQIEFKENVTTHGDLQFDNIIVNEDGKLYLVDWDWLDRSQSDLRFEIAWSYWLNRIESNKEIADKILEYHRNLGRLDKIDLFLIHVTFNILSFWLSYEGRSKVNPPQIVRSEEEIRKLLDRRDNHYVPVLLEIIREFSGIEITI